MASAYVINGTVSPARGSTPWAAGIAPRYSRTSHFSRSRSWSGFCNVGLRY